MRRKAVITITTYSVLCLAGIVSFTLPDKLQSASAQSAPPSMTLNGTVRDFRNDHPDFSVSAAPAVRHIAGNVSTSLVSGLPEFTGAGYTVVSEWQDANGNNIAPNLFGVWNPTGLCYANAGIAVDGELILDNQAQVDSFDSSVGPYGGANVEANALIATNSTDPDMLQNVNSSDIFGDALIGVDGDPSITYETQPNSTMTGSVGTLSQMLTMPSLSVPSPSSTYGDVVIAAGTTSTIDRDVRVRSMTIEPDAKLRVKGDITIVCDRRFFVKDYSSTVRVAGEWVTTELWGQIEVLGNSSLTLYLRGDYNELAGEVNLNTFEPDLCTINVVGDGDLALRRKRCHVVANVSAPDGHLSVEQGAHLYGTYVGESVAVRNQGNFHVDTNHMFDFNPPPDSPGAVGAADDGGVDAKDTFAHWFDDVLGQNLAVNHKIELIRDSDGVYEYSESAFYPIDSRVFGNDTTGHNALFTYTIDAKFTYVSCVDQFIEFTGDGDTWIYINGELVMDLGGMLPGVSQYVELDRLGLNDGQAYQLLFLHARRHNRGAAFELRTNIPLRTSTAATVSAGFD